MINGKKSMTERISILIWKKFFRNSVNIVLFFGISILAIFVIWLELKLGLLSNLWNTYY